MKKEWISSDLLGANVYELIGEHVDSTSNLAKTREMDPYNDVIDFISVRGLRDVHELSAVYASSGFGRRWEELIRIVEESQSEFLYDSRYMWPIDCVSGKDSFGYIVKKYSESQYAGISEYFVKPSAERWKLSTKLLETVGTIHESGFALNGITREQVRVNKSSGDVLIYPGFYLSWADSSRFDESRGGFFLMPEKIRKESSKRGIFTARQHDIYSSVTMVFYLLFYTHPFIGGKFWPYPHDQYYSQYSNHPEFIFADGSSNCLQNLEFDNVIADQWDRTHSALRGLFKELYGEVCSEGKIQSHLDVWDLSKWLEAIKIDASINDNARSRPDFPFETVVNYKV